MHSREVLQAVAHIHATNIDQGFLSSLGPRFLTLLYEAIDADEKSFLLVERVDGKVTGFVSGTLNMSSIYRALLAMWPRLFLALLPALMSPRKILKIAELLMRKHPAGESRPVPRAELLSLAVLPAFRQLGQAQRLYQGLVEEMAQRNQWEFKIVVGDQLDTAHRFYQKMGALPLLKTEVHKGHSSTIYVHTIAPRDESSAAAASPDQH